jgi:aspartate beta-hydroxylase
MVTTADVSAKAKAAGDAARRGDLAGAQVLWLDVVRHDPGHPDANFALGVHAYQRGDRNEAGARFRAAAASDRGTAGLRFTVARSLQQIGDLEGQFLALDAALAADPYFLPAMLAKAAWLEAAGQRAQASICYGNSLKMVGPAFNWPEAFKEQLHHAEAFVTTEAAEKEAWLHAAVQGVRSQFADESLARFDEAVSIMAGRTKPYHHDPVMMHIPRLPAQTFFERETLPFLADLEARTDDIREEMLNARRVAPHLFQPYVRYRPGEPVNQWEKLNHSDAWAGMFIWKDGMLQKEAAALCPITAAAFGALPMPRIEGYCPTVMFSALAPGAHIPPHTGETNARLVGHLPLIVPETGCRYRVGYDWRQWEVGKCLVFDDSIEHEAINDSDELRVVVLFDLWNPHLTAAERELAGALLNAQKRYGL